MDIPIKRFNKDLPLPKPDDGAACFDMVCRQPVTIQPQQIKGVPLNFALQIPDGYALLVFVRSSTPLRKGLMLANGVGVVDPFYRGDNDENLAFLYNFTNQPVTVEAGEKVVQGMIIKTEPVIWNEVEDFNEAGHGGYRYKTERG